MKTQHLHWLSWRYALCNKWTLTLICLWHAFLFTVMFVWYVCFATTCLSVPKRTWNWITISDLWLDALHGFSNCMQWFTLSLSLSPSLSLSLSLSYLFALSTSLSVPLSDTNDVQRVVVTLSRVLANVSCFLFDGSDARGCSISISIGTDILIEQNISHQVTICLNNKASHF